MISTVKKGSVLVRVHCIWRPFECLNSRMWYHMYIRPKFSQIFKNTQKLKRPNFQRKFLRLAPKNYFLKRLIFRNSAAKTSIFQHWLKSAAAGKISKTRRIPATSPVIGCFHFGNNINGTHVNDRMYSAPSK